MLDWLLLDMNSFFASCEQQVSPHLRGRPVGVVPVEDTDSTCIIAASHQAKKYGVKTGVPVGDAKKMCPGLVLVKGRASLYREIHEQVVAALEECLHVDYVMSIDEMACRLIGDERIRENALVLAQKVKRTVQARAGECMTSSVGLAPNRFWAKIASDMKKPDGLVCIEPQDIPVVIHELELRDIIGVGRGMEKRLKAAGIYTTTQLWHTDRRAMRAIWGGIEGERFYDRLRGTEIGYEKTATRSIGHQHVLEPHLRNKHGTWIVARDLLAKAAERMRRYGYFCSRMYVQVKMTRGRSAAHGYMGSYMGGYLETGRSFAQTQDTLALINVLAELWRDLPAQLPSLRVSVTLAGLVPVSAHQPDLWTSQTEPKRLSLMQAVDRINDRFGRKTLKFGHQETSPIPDKEAKIAFQRVPELWEYRK